uniref:F-box domain-containing protein n=1 Tax=Trieres chinensis TaxID=1514140 RepID=A0A7S2EHG2_TRICV|mmetsp:Transcript_23942/g.48468  ORF Transcript_23942/g.48468 Transcript_23942/m.48468 type:complete len:301 (+) Transcript_23942:92-994(+)|eukprot:CAMPEP_0183317382 /NCGR_PEP_ID=MMETSP0160_2-20130417/57762_1 /TAXON_ID=2839 ORGANISM="Odontella Sinensis, Strain Grunow 1884" /NCGR_SAMPLE_ID=MMETSP0160_2 /ASSEMBLY_ACC=CAM_ASM_000250 /LENGTH=300 /DNA_ID=CAMNT_0025483391 /DNA_START=76 /DNA_END=978 /DNA_ORIENTATION=+
MASTNPSLPPLYFLGKLEGHPPQHAESSELLSLPSETIQHCLAGFSNWGDLARLACVKKSWSSSLHDSAKYGGHDAKWELANSLLSGAHGLAENPALAVRYLRELAGVSLDEEIRSDNDRTVNATFFAPAMRKLAFCHFTGAGVETDLKAGLRWLELAYHCGNDIDAAHELALTYEYGEHGVEVDVVAAADWFKIAASSGHAEAMAEYALCCELGCGVEQNDEEALDWYMKAAQAGHVSAKYSVGEAFEEARGVPQSDTEACLWYYKAAVEGDEDSKRALRRLRDIARIVLPGWEGVLDA